MGKVSEAACGLLVLATFAVNLRTAMTVEPVSPILEEYLLKVFDNLEDESIKRSSFVEDQQDFFYSDTRGDDGKCKPAEMYMGLEDIDA